MKNKDIGFIIVRALLYAGIVLMVLAFLEYQYGKNTLKFANTQTIRIDYVFAESYSDVTDKCKSLSSTPIVHPVLYGCALVEKTRCLIVVVKPSNFEDTEKLVIVGHEMLHCFGEDHDE